MYRAKGFTLVEIAIVLVIIGLLLGGILKGQEMITQAKIKNVISDFSGVSAAYHGYVDRYKKIPGDDLCAGSGATAAACGTTTARWSGASSGNGDGILQGAYATGKRMRDFGLERLGAEVRGVRRAGERATLDADQAGALREGDVVVLLGRAEALDAAESVLLRG